jgi:hypothetical protein
VDRDIALEHLRKVDQRIREVAVCISHLQQEIATSSERGHDRIPHRRLLQAEEQILLILRDNRRLILDMLERIEQRRHGEPAEAPESQVERPAARDARASRPEATRVPHRQR